MKTIQIKNLLENEEITIFVNNYSCKYNLATYLLINANKISQLHNEVERKKVNDSIEVIKSKSNKIFAFCEKHNLIAKIIN